MEDRHFVHQAAQFAVGAGIAAGFQQQHLEAGSRKVGGERPPPAPEPTTM